ncbi:hypothetical protein [Streptomyces sp. NPDC056304]|uniref:hypothetical protein n=1 Tax=Streptomyces sp. NPDC056304 TaxID=3345778 RepID=UPI0035E32249
MTASSATLSAARRSAVFFTKAREAHSALKMPLLHDGDRASCPNGTLWIRSQGMWVAPGHTEELCLTDSTVAGWWNLHPRPENRFALVQQLTSDSFDRISARNYYDDLTGELVEGQALRHTAARFTAGDTITAHLELPSGYVTLHSTRAPLADAVYLPIRS